MIRLTRRKHLGRVQYVIDQTSAGYLSPGVPEDGIWEKAKPTIDKKEAKIRSDPLDPLEGERIMGWVRENRFGSRADVIWTLVWRYGFRVSAIRALDVDHLILSPDDEPGGWPDDKEFIPHLKLRDRPHLEPPEDEEDDEEEEEELPDPGLPLKNTNPDYASRFVPIQPEDVETFRRYVYLESPTGAKESRKVFNSDDKYGLRGFVTSQHSPRISSRTVQAEVHWLTCPTTYMAGECRCEGCREYRAKNDGKNAPPSRRGRACDKSRSPHQCRHGALTNMLNEGYDHETVAKVVGTSTKTIREVYDHGDEYDKLARTASGFLD